MPITFLFDIDGTLTKPQQAMSQGTTELLVDLSKKHNVFLVTGNDLDTSLSKQQINTKLEHNLQGIFTCQGNELWQKGECVFRNKVRFPNRMKFELRKFLENTEYPQKTGKHINERVGMINFSVVGRNADALYRTSYYEWDKKVGERELIARQIRGMFKDYEVTIGGEISIDITKKGENKGRVLHHLRQLGFDTPVYFFGDKMHEGGNDYPLAKALEAEDADNRVYPVESPQDTLDYLTKL